MTRMVPALLAAALAALSAPARAAPMPSPLQQSIDRSAILDLFNWTLIAFDNKQYSQFLAAFAPDAVFDVVDADPKNDHHFTRDQMAAQFGTRPGTPGGDHHMASNLTVRFLDSTHAKLHGYYAWMKPGSAGQIGVAALGAYDILLTKSGAAWRFQDYKLIHSDARLGPSPLD